MTDYLNPLSQIIMRKIARLLATQGLFLAIILIAGCKKDSPDTTVPVGQPTITASYSLMPDGASSQSILAHVEWTSENATKGTLDGLRIKTPNGDTTFNMKKGDKKTLLFKVENASGKSFQEYLKIEIPSDPIPPIPPTISASVTYNGQTVDTLPYLGGEVKIKVFFANGILELNGVKYENSPKELTFTVTETKTYDFKVVGAGGEISLPFTVPVYVPTETELLLISGTWVVTKLEESCYTPDGPWSPIYDYIGVKRTFFLSPNKMKREGPCPEGTCIYWYDWSLNGSVITGFGDRTIISINSNEMILILESFSTQNNVQIPWFVRETCTK